MTRLAEIRARLDAVPRQKWHVYPSSGNGYPLIVAADDWPDKAPWPHPNNTEIVIGYFEPDAESEGCFDVGDGVAALIAAAPQDLAWLLGEVARLREALGMCQVKLHVEYCVEDPGCAHECEVARDALSPTP